MPVTHGSALARIPSADPPAALAQLARPTTANAVAAAFLLGRHNPNTRAAYGRDLAAWFAYCASVGVDPLDARQAHVDAWRVQLDAAGLAPSTVARRLSALSGFYARAMQEGCCAVSPVALVERPTVADESQTLGLDKAQLGALLDAAERSSARDYALVCLLALNGLRVSEALAVELPDLGMERGHRTVKLWRKRGKRQTAALAPRTAAAIDALIAERDPELSASALFVTRSGRRLDRQAAWKIVRRLARDAGIEGAVCPHSCRHGFITAALDAGVPLRDVQDAAAHSDPRTTRRYDHGRNSLDRHATYAVASLVAA